MADGTEVAN